MKLYFSDGTFIEVMDTNAGGVREGQTYSYGNPTALMASGAIEPVIKFCQEALARINEAVSPQTLEIEFGLEAGGEGGLFGIAKASSKATINVKLTWGRDTPE